MVKKLELSKYDAKERILLFLKLRKGKQITEKTVIDLNNLLDKLNANFKDYEDNIISNYREKANNNKIKAYESMKSGFIKWEGGGNCRLTDIDNFSTYNDGTQKVCIKGVLRNISENDYFTLDYIFL